MKLLPSILTGLLISSLIYNFFQYKSNKTEELTAQRDSLIQQAETLETQQEILSDRIFYLQERLGAQDLVIQSREQEIVRTKKEANEFRNKYNSIKFVVYSDSGRLAELKKLYPSWK